MFFVRIFIKFIDNGCFCWQLPIYLKKGNAGRLALAIVLSNTYIVGQSSLREANVYG
ncbi:hypothetical protein DEU29_10458 [Idiomarina aquatica]|uniref:Uncharacterized protein n=1 Tax=Idiomarina aquatica TaxID=1327752 RepID=A0A4R6PKK6_9GAMM|nr:hypothetical protein DEU29_10458 [Idiomarina aquatica]